MFKKIKNSIVTALATALFLMPLGAVQLAHAQSCDSGDINTGLQCGTCLSATDSSCDTGGTPESRVNSILKTVINIFSLIVGIVSVIFVIVGGLKFITSSGDAGNVSSAQKTIIYALVGLVVVALAQVIVRFVLAKATTP